MPVLILLGLGAAAGLYFSSTTGSALSALEGAAAGLAVGVGVAAIYFIVLRPKA